MNLPGYMTGALPAYTCDEEVSSAPSINRSTIDNIDDYGVSLNEKKPATVMACFFVMKECMLRGDI